MIIIASYSNVSVTYTADGTQTVFSFPFDYLRKAFVFVEVNGETVLEQGTDYTVSDDKTVVFQTAPVVDTVLRIYRQTDTRPLVSWADASVLRAKDMTIQQVQVLHILEEDQKWIQDNTINKADGKWDAGNAVIGNVGNPENPDDAATKEYIDETYEYVKGKLDDLDSAVETATEAKDTAEDAADRAEAALDEIKEKASWYDNVASMRNAEGLQIGMVAGTKGYHTPNDGGNSFYIIREKDNNNDVDDGGSIIFLDNGNVAELITNGSVTLKQFGAKGDGVTDDTTAFNNALNFTTHLRITKGTYLIDFSGNLLYNKKITGENKINCVIKQKNSNSPFLQISQKAEVADLTIVSLNNTTPTGVLLFGRLVYFNRFDFHYIHNVNFEGNEYSIPLYFNMLNGGCVGGVIETIYIKNCYKGVWFHFHTGDTVTIVQWLTSHTMRDIFIENPAEVGFEWDDLPYNPTYLKNNISYNNYFGNVAVELFKSGSTGFKIGNHMGVLENPMCYNDIQISQEQPDPYGYSIEICPVGTPIQYKHYTKIIGGSLEGLLKNPEYMYLVNCQNVNTSSRRRFDSEQYYEIYNSLDELNYDYLNAFDPFYISDKCSLNNCIFRYGEDHQGVYLEFVADSSLASSATWGWDITIPKSSVVGTPNNYGKATFLALAQYSGNHRIYASGLTQDATTDPYFTYNQEKYNGSMIDLVHFDTSSDSTTGEIHIGFTSPKSDGTTCRVYGLYLLRGIVGSYWIIDKVNNNRITLKDVTVGLRKKSFTNSGNVTTVIYPTRHNIPGGKVFGQLPACNSGSTITIGTLDDYASSTVTFKIMDNSTGSTMGNLRIAWNGVVTYTATATHGALGSVAGAY